MKTFIGNLLFHLKQVSSFIYFSVAVQNEKYDDWCGILVQLRKIFSEYLKIVLEYHSRPDVVIPPATNSTAAQGNFLEVLNMSLNGNFFSFFNYIDRL